MSLIPVSWWIEMMRATPGKIVSEIWHLRCGYKMLRSLITITSRLHLWSHQLTGFKGIIHFVTHLLTDFEYFTSLPSLFWFPFNHLLSLVFIGSSSNVWCLSCMMPIISSNVTWYFFTAYQNMWMMIFSHTYSRRDEKPLNCICDSWFAM